MILFWIFLVLVVLIPGVVFLIGNSNFKKVVKRFEKHSVSVTGMKGSGKDLIFGNVIARRKKAYVSNLDYGGKFYFLEYEKIDCGGNDYISLVEGDVSFYTYPYPVGSDIYISDAGVYFPAQYNAELNRRYKHLPTFLALSRQIADAKVHTNQQNLTRVWDKIREHSDYYIYCRKCIYIFGFVLQKITLYDKAESCQNRVNPCRVRRPLFNAQAKATADTYLDNFYNTHGMVRNMFLFYRNKSKHDSHYFGQLFRRGRLKNEKKEK